MGHVLAFVIVCLAGCYQSPSLASCKYRCGGANNNACPSGYDCVAGMCVTNNESCDGDGGVIDGPPIDSPDDDAMLIDAPVCADPNLVFWTERAPLDTESNLSQLVVVDANDDGKPDLAVLDASNSIGAFLGLGDGTFETRKESAAGSNAIRIAVGNFDQDTKRDDLVVLNDNTFRILTSVGNGFYTDAPYPIGTTGTPVDIASPGDIDGDMDDDLVILTRNTSATLALATQQPASSTWSVVDVQNTGLATATSLFVGDVDGTGMKDALIVRQTGLWFYAGLTGTPVDVGVPTSVVSSAAAQLRTSGLRTVVSANGLGNNVSIRHFNGGTTFENVGQLAAGGTSDPVAVFLAQIAGDPLPDVLTANRGAAQFGLFINTGTGFLTQDTTGTASMPVDIVAADFDGDLRNDVAVAHSLGVASRVTIFLNKCTP